MTPTELRAIATERRQKVNAKDTRLTRALDRAADEIERLTAALESLTKDPPATLDEPDTDAEVIKKMRAIALAALHPNRAGQE